MDWWVGLEGWLRWAVHPLGGAVCRDHTELLLLAPQKWQLVLAFLYLIHNLPYPHMHAVIFSPL